METKAVRKKKLTKEEFRALMPNKLNKLGLWLVEHYNDEPRVDTSAMSKTEKASYMRAVLK
ncbi:MAG TPA: hypothetical protein H9848_00570 [Candidatus Parabacteroides intestinigallinarum]|uniref:Uncharacterized protein n=1 Tax=Candidatus Parabacteroides intestinigallinarum TaxID=2838722 RepID=A0A9D1XNX9_9BACT|nr:hypothetical protein [Candidatus Parabacteroides intestinigallinarum]